MRCLYSNAAALILQGHFKGRDDRLRRLVEIPDRKDCSSPNICLGILLYWDSRRRRGEAHRAPAAGIVLCRSTRITTVLLHRPGFSAQATQERAYGTAASRFREIGLRQCSQRPKAPASMR